MHDHKKTNKFTNIERMLLPSDALGSYLHGPSPMATCLRCGPILLEKGPDSQRCGTGRPTSQKWSQLVGFANW